MIGAGLPLSLSSRLHPRGPVRRSTVRSQGVLSIVLEYENVCNAGIFGDDRQFPGIPFFRRLFFTDKSRIDDHLPFEHDSVNHSAGGYVRGDVHTNSMESVWAVLKNRSAALGATYWPNTCTAMWMKQCSA